MLNESRHRGHDGLPKYMFSEIDSPRTVAAVGKPTVDNRPAQAYHPDCDRTVCLDGLVSTPNQSAVLRQSTHGCRERRPSSHQRLSASALIRSQGGVPCERRSVDGRTESKFRCPKAVGVLRRCDIENRCDCAGKAQCAAFKALFIG